MEQLLKSPKLVLSNGVKTQMTVVLAGNVCRQDNITSQNK